MGKLKRKRTKEKGKRRVKGKFEWLKYLLPLIILLPLSNFETQDQKIAIVCTPKK